MKKLVITIATFSLFASLGNIFAMKKSEKKKTKKRKMVEFKKRKHPKKRRQINTQDWRKFKAKAAQVKKITEELGKKYKPPVLEALKKELAYIRTTPWFSQAPLKDIRNWIKNMYQQIQEDLKHMQQYKKDTTERTEHVKEEIIPYSNAETLKIKGKKYPKALFGPFKGKN